MEILLDQHQTKLLVGDLQVLDNQACDELDINFGPSLDDGVAASFQRSRIQKPHAHTQAFKVNHSNVKIVDSNLPHHQRAAKSNKESSIGEIIPNDDERVNPSLISDQRSQSDISHSFMHGGNTNTKGFPDENLGNDAQRSDDIFATHDENYNDFIVDSKVKYGLEKYVGYSKLNSKNYYFVTHLNKNHEPKSFFEASKFSHWTDAMNKEMDALLRNDTWDIVDLPKDGKAIRCKWIFKIKYKSSGEIDRYKARLVAYGFSQKEGIDYEEKFSPIVKMVTVRYLLNIDVSNSWPVFQLDVNNAFLYGDLVVTVYMQPPEGYFCFYNKVCRLKKSLYGLKQAPRHWNSKLSFALIEMVIDTNKGICLNQRKYVLDLLSEYGMLACKPAKIPLMSKLTISNEATNDDLILDNITDYQ
ncbi:ribonuclease H-like domain-containing protein [Tanacetum coccineum]